jgi:hypothetical protein
VEIEVLMNMELPIERSLKRWKFQSNEPEKERQVVKFLMKRKSDGDGAFQEKSKNKKVNLEDQSPRKPMDLSIVIC